MGTVLSPKSAGADRALKVQTVLSPKACSQSVLSPKALRVCVLSFFWDYYLTDTSLKKTDYNVLCCVLVSFKISNHSDSFLKKCQTVHKR